MTSTALDSVRIERILRGFRTDTHVRERLPGGVLNIDRKLPYLFVYRQPRTHPDQGTERLVLGEAAYLVALGEEDAAELAATVRALAETATLELGSFLLLELWAGPADDREFVVHTPGGNAAVTADTLIRELQSLSSNELAVGVRVLTTDERHTPALPPLLSARECWDIGCLSLGLQVPPIYRDAATGTVYPVFLRHVRQLLSAVLRQTAFEFARVQTTAGFESHRALGPRRFDSGVTNADTELAEIAQSFELLLLLAPVNPREAWETFRDAGCARPPQFRYRLLPVDPDLLKRRLYTLDLEDAADPAMGFLLRDKRDELEKQITLIAERNTPGFRFESIRLFGAVDDVLLDVARDILRSVQLPKPTGSARVRAAEFARRAALELEHYRRVAPELASDIQIRSDMVGLMVSQGNVLISERLGLRPERVDALLHHEVGTHVLTYCNGRAQPLRQLYTGLAGYDELQEGLAVFAEYLAGGLDAARMRLLAARVLAAHSVEHGADFLQTFRLLVEQHGFSREGAFDIAERVHQSGGFTRDLIYLRGLLRLVEYLRADGAIEPLYVGKIAAKHIEIADELRARGFLRAPRLLPRVFELDGAQERLHAVRRGLPLTAMVSTLA